MISSQVILWKVSILVMWYYASNCNDYIIFMVYLQKNIYIHFIYTYIYIYKCSNCQCDLFSVELVLVMVYVSVKDTKEGSRDGGSVASRTDLITSNCHIHVKTYKVLKVQ